MNIWFRAIRPRTLPLAGSAVILGFALAGGPERASSGIFALCFATALLLQILSNLANDYGDAIRGTDAERLGPARMVGSGLASPAAMFRAVCLTAALAACSGLVLVVLAARHNPFLLAFLPLGLCSLAAAVMYTMGKIPYGYLGLGDVMAGVFFGPVAVWGSCLLCGGIPDAGVGLTGLAAGLCSVMVLNVNNMRDMDTDRRAGKRTVAVRLGLPGAARYHALLALLTLVLWIVFCLARNAALLPGLILFLPLGCAAWKAARQAGNAPCLNRQLRATVLASALLNAGMGILCLAVS